MQPALSDEQVAKFAAEGASTAAAYRRCRLLVRRLRLPNLLSTVTLCPLYLQQASWCWRGLPAPRRWRP